MYQSPLNPVTFEGWTNTNGAPLPGMDDENAMFDWITVDVGFDVPISTTVASKVNPSTSGITLTPRMGCWMALGWLTGSFLQSWLDLVCMC